MTEEKKAELLGRITPTADPADLAGCDLVIEAVFEDPALKAKVFAEMCRQVNSDALLCSNTSTLPITELAEGVDRPADFIGLHFFCPVDKMPLVEIIRGEKTSDEARRQGARRRPAIRKTPIVVNDSRGFYTRRVIGTMVNEGLAMLAEGVHPVSVERAATQAGYPVGTLQLSDELNMELMAKIRKATRDAVEREGGKYVAAPGRGRRRHDDRPRAARPAEAAPASTSTTRPASARDCGAGSASTFPVAAEQPPFDDLKDRLLFIEAVETARCFEEGVIESAAAANIGSIFGIGFPANTGGSVQFMTGYEGHEGTASPGS